MALPIPPKTVIIEQQIPAKFTPYAWERKTELGQYMTPAKIAQFMTSLFNISASNTIRLLDPGAGLGSLSSSFLDACIHLNQHIDLELCAFEIDPFLSEALNNTFQAYQTKFYGQKPSFSFQVFNEDFIEQAVTLISTRTAPQFTHAILNPPYKKLHRQSKHRADLRSIGIVTVNLYSAFMMLTINLLGDGGELVAIVPRSFCNGSYYKRFREQILTHTAIKQIHLFQSRNSAFKDDDVLQENIIIHLTKNGSQKDVRLSFSNDETLSDFTSYECQFSRIVDPKDPELFIRIPDQPKETESSSTLSLATFSLSEIETEVSTGPVVDFRLKDYLRDQPDLDCVPLLYPLHFINNTIVWPSRDSKKPNAIKCNPETAKWLWPNGFYVVVRRLSSKEEKRRIVASLVDPAYFNSATIAFENHLNVFHCAKSGLEESFAHGLVCFLNSSYVDELFRSFNGHTQVNATDLRSLKYPSREILSLLGEWAKTTTPSDECIDQKIKELLR